MGRVPLCISERQALLSSGRIKKARAVDDYKQKADDPMQSVGRNYSREKLIVREDQWRQ